VLGLETAYFPHAKPDKILAHAGLDADGIAASVSAALGHLRATRGDGRPLDEVLGIES
jgi:deoxyxylulose-5-phosphate synthase